MLATAELSYEWMKFHYFSFFFLCTYTVFVDMCIFMLFLFCFVLFLVATPSLTRNNGTDEVVVEPRAQTHQ